MASVVATLRSSFCSLISNPPQCLKAFSLLISPLQGGEEFSLLSFFHHFIKELFDYYQHFRKARAVICKSSAAAERFRGLPLHTPSPTPANLHPPLLSLYLLLSK